MLTSLFLKMQQHDVLSEQEKALLLSTISGQKRFAARQDLVVEGSRPSTSTLLIEGFAARYKLAVDGSRQITAIHIPGDFVDLHGFLLKTMDHGIMALSPCLIASADHGALRTVTETAPHLTRMLWLDTLVDGAIHRNWIVAMGRRSRAAHLAHLICELYLRLRIVQKTEGDTFHFPLSQAEMADVLGISAVHMNRVVQQLRRENVIDWESQRISIHDWPRLHEIAEFDSVYLALEKEPR